MQKSYSAWAPDEQGQWRAMQGRQRMILDHLRRMARYNAWANQRLYECCRQLEPGEFIRHRPAAFGSISGTLNHLLVTDRIWLDRFQGRPHGGQQLDDRPYPRLDDLRPQRTALDEEIVAVVDGLGEADLTGDLTYGMLTRPEQAVLPRLACWTHLFNHQTHHRGQVHDQISHTMTPPPSLDLVLYVRELQG